MVKQKSSSASTSTTSKKYETFTLGVGKARKDLKAKLDATAKSLGCSPADLTWHAIEKMLENPPKTAPANARPATGNANGFWVVPETNADGKGKAIHVLEVNERSQVTQGRTFFRFKAGDEKGRGLAQRQALRAAAYDCNLLGLTSTGLQTVKFDPKKHGFAIGA